MILWLIACGFCFVAGMLHGQGKLIPWVRGAAGKARGVVFGLRPARNSNPTSNLPRDAAQEEKTKDIPATSAEFKPAILADIPRPVPPGIFGEIPVGNVSPTPPKNPIRAGQATKNILAFFGGLLAWMAKNPMLAIGLVLLVLFLTLGRSCVRLPQVGDLFKSRDTIIAERDNANTNTEVAQHETRVENRGAELADETHRDARRREEVIAQAEQEFSDAVSQADFDRLHSAYERATAGVWSGLELEGEPDHSPRGSDPVRRSSADTA